MLDILDKYKVNPRVLERLQKQVSDQSDVDVSTFDWKLEAKKHLMNKEKGFLVQHRREYYNDFEDCLREYKNAKIKSLQKQTKVHLSDGDNNADSDAEYVDCTESNDLKNQSTLSSKSMPHVPSGNYKENFCQKLEVQSATLPTELEPQSQKPLKTQLKANSDISRIENKTPAQLTSNNNNHNQIINTSCKNTSTVNEECKVNPEKSIEIDDNIHISSTSIVDTKVPINTKTVDRRLEPNEAAKPLPVQIPVKKDEQTRRKSCKKKPEGTMKDPTQR